jgi:hypothetical protein
LQDDDTCTLCGQLAKTFDHLLLACVFSREFWFKMLRSVGWQQLAPQSEDKFLDWWLSSRKRLPKDRRKGFDTLFSLIIWSIWLKQNAHVFHGESKQVQRLIADIRDEAAQWVSAGFSSLLIMRL